MRPVVLFEVIFGGRGEGGGGKDNYLVKGLGCQLYNFVPNIMEYVVYYSSIV